MKWFDSIINYFCNRITSDTTFADSLALVDSLAVGYNADTYSNTGVHLIILIVAAFIAYYLLKSVLHILQIKHPQMIVDKGLYLGMLRLVLVCIVYFQIMYRSYDFSGHFQTGVAAAIALLLLASSYTAVRDLICGILLGVSRSFKPGDTIQIGEYEGKVIRRKAFRIELEDRSGGSIHIPNSSVFANPFRNKSTDTTFPVEFKLVVPESSDLPKLRTAVLEAVSSFPYSARSVEPMISYQHLQNGQLIMMIKTRLVEERHEPAFNCQLTEIFSDYFREKNS